MTATPKTAPKGGFAFGNNIPPIPLLRTTRRRTHPPQLRTLAQRLKPPMAYHTRHRPPTTTHLHTPRLQQPLHRGTPHQRHPRPGRLPRPQPTGTTLKIVVPQFTEPDGYRKLLAYHWRQRHTFIVLEADKHTSGQALTDLWQCGEAWCTYPIPMQHSDEPAPFPSLGCTKFDAELMHRYPELMWDIATLGDLGVDDGKWSRLDLAIAGLLERHTACHQHQAGVVEHRHVSPDNAQEAVF